MRGNSEVKSGEFTCCAKFNKYRQKNNLKWQLGLMLHFRSFKRFFTNVIKSVHQTGFFLCFSPYMLQRSHAILFTYLYVCVINASSLLPGGLVLAVSELIQATAEGLSQTPRLSLSTEPTLGWTLLPICHPGPVRPTERLGSSGETGGVAAAVRGSVKL